MCAKLDPQKTHDYSVRVRKSEISVQLRLFAVVCMRIGLAIRCPANCLHSCCCLRAIFSRNPGMARPRFCGPEFRSRTGRSAPVSLAAAPCERHSTHSFSEPLTFPGRFASGILARPILSQLWHSGLNIQATSTGCSAVGFVRRSRFLCRRR